MLLKQKLSRLRTSNFNASYEVVIQTKEDSYQYLTNFAKHYS